MFVYIYVSGVVRHTDMKITHEERNLYAQISRKRRHSRCARAHGERGRESQGEHGLAFNKIFAGRNWQIG